MVSILSAATVLSSLRRRTMDGRRPAPHEGWWSGDGRANASDYRRPHPPDQIGAGASRSPGPDPGISSALLTIVSTFVENDCHERTPPHTHRRRRRSRRPSASPRSPPAPPPTRPRAASDGKLDVVASFYPMQFLAEEIGGTHVSVTTLTKPGVEPHDLELTPADRRSSARPTTIVYLKGLQPAVDDAVAQAGVKNTVDAASSPRWRSTAPRSRATTTPRRARSTRTRSTGTRARRPASTRTSGWTR